MNIMKTCTMLLGLSWLALAVSVGQTTDTSQVTASTNSPVVEQPGAPSVVTDQPSTTEPAVAEKPSETATTDTVAAAEAPAGDDELRLNFRGAPLEMVLDYLSKAAGFTIVLETEVKGKVDVWNNHPLTKDEAVAVLDSALNRNGYAAIRNGRTLTIMSRDEAKKRNIPVMPGSNPEAIPKTDEMVTQIIPVRYANVSQLLKDLEPLKPAYATLTANDSANALVLTDTRANVRRMVEIVNALDTSVSSVSTVRVFPLKYADAKDLAAAVKELFTAPTNNQQQGNNARQFFRGFGGGGPGGGGPGGGQGSGGDNAAAQRVVPHVSAVADDRSNSLVVSAPEEYIPTIEQLVREIDVSVSDVTELRVFHLANADPVETASLFAQLFPDDSRTADQNQAAVRFRGGLGGFFNQGNAPTTQTAASDRMKKKGQVIAVPDQRTSSVIISAAGDLMPQIAAMIEQLDGNSSKKQSVYVIPLENAEVTDVLPVLKDMFNKDTTTQRNNSSTQNGQNDALTSRTTRNNQGTTTSSMGRGTGVGGGGGGAGGF
jgi:type II secretory pathway component GspD/PulD (secretin)